MQVTYKFRLYPSISQEEKLLKTIEICRQTYNHFLSLWNGKDKIPSRLELQAQLPSLKKEEPELNEVYSKVLQMVLYQLYSNLKSLSQLKKNRKKVGKLRYKGKGWFKTFTYNQSGFKIVKTGKRLDLLRLSKIGDIPIRIHREVKGGIKQIVIKRHNSGKWFTCICVEEEIQVEKKNVKRAVGIDVGIKHFLTDSDGIQIENPRFYEKTLRRIKVVQHWLSKKQKGSKNREKQRIKLARLHEKLVNQRDDFLHKLSRFYVANYDFIAVENLNIKGIVRNHNLAGKILDASWRKFLQLLSYKAENAGKVVVKVNPRGTSRECMFGKLDRDYDASLNILMRGLSGLGRPFEPAETEPLRELTQVPASSITEAGSPLR
jgi:putative transposase